MISIIYLMTPSSTQYLPNELNFGSIKGRKVIANFSGERISSDAGIVLLAELDKKLKITNKNTIVIFLGQQGIEISTITELLPQGFSF